MPQIMHNDMKQLLLQLFLGLGTSPTLFMGLRSGVPSANDTLNYPVQYQEVSDTNYHRAIILTGTGSTISVTQNGISPHVNDFQIIIPTVQFNPFAAAPVIQATHWFLTNVASGTTGKLFVSAPLNPALLSGTFAMAGTVGQTVINLAGIPTGSAPTAGENIHVGDYLTFGSACKGNLEIPTVVSFGTITMGNTPVTIAPALLYNHPIGESWIRDGVTRIYLAGDEQLVSATIMLTQG